MGVAVSSGVDVLLANFGMGESPRWHDGRLWFSNWGTDEIVAVDAAGRSEVMAPAGVGLAGPSTGCRTAACSSPAPN